MRHGNIKAWFGLLYFVACAGTLFASLIGVAIGPSRLAWAGAGIASAPFIFLWIRAIQGGKSAPRGVWPALLRLVSISGLLLSATAVSRGSGTPAIAALAGLIAIGYVVFDLWYSRFGRPTNPQLRPGQKLPVVSARDMSGTEISTADLEGTPALLMFFRGNWCPFCTAQIRQLARRYRELNDRGVRLVFVSPQPADFTRRVADSLDVAIEFWVDSDCSAARGLGLLQQDGVPVGLRDRYGRDTVLPTAILLDADGRVIYCDETDNYRVRPRPEVFLEVFRSHGI
jgi:peroxiredoxin